MHNITDHHALAYARADTLAAATSYNPTNRRTNTEDCADTDWISVVISSVLAGWISSQYLGSHTNHDVLLLAAEPFKTILAIEVRIVTTFLQFAIGILCIIARLLLFSKNLWCARLGPKRMWRDPHSSLWQLWFNATNKISHSHKANVRRQ
jgi:hypothetical protein